MITTFRFVRSLDVETAWVETLIAVLLISPALTIAQNPPQTPPTPAWMSTPQTSTQNFPPLLLQQLSAI
jgi:hypothetical protein